MSRARDISDIHDGSTDITTLGTVTTGTFNGTVGDSVTFPDVSKNLPAFEVYKSANQGLTNLATTKVSFDTISFDTNNAYDETTNYRFITPTGHGGKYFFYSVINATTLAVSQLGYFDMRFRKNGSISTNDNRVAYHYPDNNPGAQATITLNAIFNMSGTSGSEDYIEVYVNVYDYSGNPQLDAVIGSGQAVYFGGYKLIGG